MSRTALLLEMFDHGDIPNFKGGTLGSRQHEICRNRLRVKRWVDIVDVTRGPNEAMHREKMAGDRHAAFMIPIPLWLGDRLLRVLGV